MKQISMRVGLTLALMLSYLLQAGSATSILAPAQAAPVSFKQERSLISDGKAPKMAASPALTSSVFLPLIIGPAFIVRPPNPLELTMSLDSSRAMTATLPLSGGTLVTASATLARAGGTLAATAGGVRFQLTIPPDALLYTTTIVMTPISNVVGLSPTVQFVGGVHLEPDGLRLFKLATLTMTPPTTIPVTQQVAFASRGLGQSAYLYPLQLGTSQIVFNLMHLSDYAVALGQGPVPSQFNPNNIPMLPEDQYMEAAAQLSNQQRAAEQSGQPGDPQFWQKLQSLSRGYYQVVLLNQLNQALSDCTNMRELLMPAIGWSRQMQLVFGASNNPFDSEIANVMSVSVQALINCWNKLRCVHWNIKSEVQQVLSLARQLQLMTGSDQYDPFSLPECPCDQITSQQNWSGAVNWSYARTVENDQWWYRLRQTGAVLAQLTVSTPGFMQDPLTGSAHLTSGLIDKTNPYSPPYIVSGGPLSGQMTVYMDPTKCTYNFWVNASVTATDQNGNSFNDIAGFMQSADKPLSNYDTELGGSGAFPAHSIVYNDGRDFYESELVAQIGGENGGGIAYVTWSFTPGP